MYYLYISYNFVSRKVPTAPLCSLDSLEVESGATPRAGSPGDGHSFFQPDAAEAWSLIVVPESGSESLSSTMMGMCLS